MTETTERFIRLFEELVAEVNKRAGVSGSFSFDIERAASRDGVVKKQQNLLRYIRDVRNALQHPKHRSQGPAVLISESFLVEIEALLDHLKNPVRAGSLGIARKRIRIASVSDRPGDLAMEMKANGFSHVPILNKHDVVVGVFNEAAVFDFLWSEDAKIIERTMSVEEILPHCRLDADHTETFRFVGPRVPIEELVDLFRAIQSPTTRVGAVFVTASGKETEKLQRLITPWDVLGRAIE
ncbi:hypothetical protein [Roseinatronobacter sp. NSM]|uniref:hypothetical protein n=1 Tax=Roseinatronobacter sp. NSM TaxID=3457785 RepID=UPI0040353361